MSENIFGRKKAAASNFSNPSLVSPNTPTLANPIRGFGLPTNNAPLQTVTEVSTDLQEAQSADEQLLEPDAIKQKPLGHDISRISLRRPQPKLTVTQPGDQYEQSADWVADRIMRMARPEPKINLGGMGLQDIMQRKYADGGVQAKPDEDTPDTPQPQPLTPNTKTDILAPSESVDAIAMQVINALQTDPKDSSGLVRRRLASLEASTYKAVLERVQASISPAQWNHLQAILIEPTSSVDDETSLSHQIGEGKTEKVANSTFLDSTSSVDTQGTQHNSTPTVTTEIAGKHYQDVDEQQAVYPELPSAPVLENQSQTEKTGDVSAAPTGSAQTEDKASSTVTTTQAPTTLKDTSNDLGGSQVDAGGSQLSANNDSPSQDLDQQLLPQAEPTSKQVAQVQLSDTDIASPASLPTLPESPDISQAAQEIIQATTTEKLALSQIAQTQRTAMMQQAEAKAQAIEATTQGKIQALIAALDSKIAEVKQSFNTTRATVKAQIESQKATAQAEGTKALSTLKKEVENKRKIALDAADNEAKQIEQGGQTEAQRVHTSSAESSNRVNAAANQQTNTHGDKKPEVQSAVRQAVSSTSADVKGKMHQRSQDLANNATAASQKSAQGFRDAGKQLAAGLGNNTAQVEKAIQEGTNATANQIVTQGTQQVKQLDALETKAAASLNKQKATSILGIQQAGKSAASSARKAGQAGVKQLNKTEAASLQQFDKAMHQIVGGLHQVPKDREVDNKEVQNLTQSVAEKLRQARVELGTDISNQANGVESSLNQLENSVSTHLETAQHKVTAEANQATTSLQSGLAQVPEQMTQQSQQAIAQNKDTNQQVVQQFGDGIQQEIDKTKQGWSNERQKVYTDIKGKVDEGVQANKDVETKAPSDFAQLGNTAAAKAEESLVSKIFSGIWEGIKKVALGLAIFAAAVLVITGAVLLVAALAGIAVVASEVLAVVIAIVGIGFLLYGFITSMIKRSDDFWKTYGTDLPWYKQVLGFFAVFGVALGDTVGVTPIIEGIVGKEAFTGKEFTPEERAEKITEGVLTIATMLIMGKLLKGLGKPGEVGSKGTDPIEPGKGTDPVEPGKGTDPVEPGKDKDPVEPGKDKDPVEPGKDKDPVEPGKDKDPVNPPKYDPKTRTDAELELDKDPTPRPGETPQEAAERAKLAEEEIVERVMDRYNGLGEKPPHVDMAANDAAHSPHAHTGRRHGAQIPMERSLDANGQPDGTRTVEGRIYNDPPWDTDGGKQNFSAKWLSQDILNQTVNRYLRNNWEQIRSDLATGGEHANSFDTGSVIGEGYFNKNYGQPGGPISKGPAPTSMVYIAIKFVPGNPPSFYIITTYPTLRGF